jgi:carbonic anhydrase/acetyltransferase-like protein (isoleucine patch superfamily)
MAPGAILIGDVTVGAESSVWFNCVLRGDFSAISIGSRSNIQDGTVIHVDEGGMSTIIGDDVTVGHGSILHGCRLMDRAFVGMGSIVLKGAEIENDGMLAAGALLTSGKRIQTGQLWAGSPAKFLRALTDSEIRDIRKNARLYAENASLFSRELNAV